MRTSLDEIGVVLRRVDSLSSTIAERYNFKIEFYPLEYGPGKPATEAAPCSTMPADSLGLAPTMGGVGGMGAVKSIEISTERTEDKAAITAMDSVSETKTATKATLQKETSSETRHDNGTVLIVAIVAGLVVFALAWLLLKTFLKR
jgi:hypothetical protein